LKSLFIPQLAAASSFLSPRMELKKLEIAQAKKIRHALYILQVSSAPL
jgi:hypothetical protein